MRDTCACMHACTYASACMAVYMCVRQQWSPRGERGRATHVHTCIHTRIQPCIHGALEGSVGVPHMCTHAYIHAYSHAYMEPSRGAWACHTCTHAGECACVRVCTFTCAHVYVHCAHVYVHCAHVYVQVYRCEVLWGASHVHIHSRTCACQS